MKFANFAKSKTTQQKKRERISFYDLTSRSSARMKCISLLMISTGCAFPLKKNVFSRRVVTSFTLSGGAHRAFAKKKVRTAGNQEEDDEVEENAVLETETSVLDMLDNHVRTMRALERFDRIYGDSDNNDMKLAP